MSETPHCPHCGLLLDFPHAIEHDCQRVVGAPWRPPPGSQPSAILRHSPVWTPAKEARARELALALLDGFGDSVRHNEGIWRIVNTLKQWDAEQECAPFAVTSEEPVRPAAGPNAVLALPRDDGTP